MLRDADLTYANQETLFHNYEDYPNTVSGEATTGTWMHSSPEMLKEYQWMGIQMMGTSNNHSLDFGENGVLTNIKNLKAYGMPYAGTGRNLTEARMPCYVDTPQGRVALVSGSDAGPGGAGDQPFPFLEGGIGSETTPYFQGKPGCNKIRFVANFTVDRETFNSLKRTKTKMDFGRDCIEYYSNPRDTDTEIFFMGSKYVLGKDCSMTTVANKRDFEENLKWIREARANADWVIVSFHHHGASRTPDEPPEHIKAFARAAIDAGADAFIGHGPHQDEGVEVYNGKPILYSLGHLAWEINTVDKIPWDGMARLGLGYDNTPSEFFWARGTARGLEQAHQWRWENAVAIVTFEKKKVKEIRLHPIDIGYGKPFSQQGRPILAEKDSEVFKRVLARFQRLSEPFGTKIHVKGDALVVDVP
jgi:poly-gamma-glutamate synthesis protein (capsule biosynthesis protein)